jgi:transposase
VKPYSLDLRERVIAALDEGQSSPKVAAQFRVSESFVRKLRIRRRKLGHFRWFPPPGRKRLLRERDEERLCLLALAHADATISELRELAATKLGLKMSLTLVGRLLRRMGMTRKKSPSGRPRWTAPMSKRSATASGVVGHSGAPNGSSSSTKRAFIAR